MITLRHPRLERMTRLLLTIAGLFVLSIAADGQGANPLLARVKQERAAYLKTLQELVSVESGSRDLEGLNRISEVIAARLRALGGDVQFVPAATDGIRFEDTPAQIGRIVLARFKGTGTRNVLLLAHMDTVYQRGAGAKQPFRIDGDRAYGLGIEDDKQGVALILHTVAMLQAMKFQQYGTLTVLINADEEIGAPGSRALITRLGREHDVVLSCESGGTGNEDRVQLATSGNGAVLLRVTGRASHAGEAPDQGRNALYELAHQIMQMRDLSDPRAGIKMNWTLASAGTVRNQIPAAAQATADVRVQRVASWDEIERRVRERVKKTLIPDTRVEVVVERRRPPLEATDASRQLAVRAQKIYAEVGRTLRISTEGSGGATDAAIAALETKAPVIEGLGMLGDGAHSNDGEYILLSSIEPRLYLLARLIMNN
jgi:glutamate carboxypeptidase